MTADDFRKLALELPEAVESSHMDHPDFRVRKKIFATLGPNEEWGMLNLTPEQQASVILAEPAVFQPIPGGWGRRGATKVLLKSAKNKTVQEALALAWRNTAPIRLVEQSEEL